LKHRGQTYINKPTKTKVYKRRGRGFTFFQPQGNFDWLAKLAPYNFLRTLMHVLS
jgi:hypothetical protein